MKVNAQQRFSFKGLVRDSLHIGIPGANVRLISGKDTLSSTTDSIGHFNFSNVKTADIYLLIRSIGYLPLQEHHVLKNQSTEQALPPTNLKSSLTQLKEVVIKAKPIPVRLMKDTVEFNADAYSVHENDKVEDLLKQLPGIEVDKEGNVTATGQAMTKIRVNGKDFFTGNVKEFISRLPADIVDKLQVIDDYGDKANFTGIKTEEPKKMLNLVLKANRNSGKFGELTASAGTNDRYALNLNGNFWKDTKQISVNTNAANTNTGAGISNNVNLGTSYRNKLNDKLVMSAGYNYAYSHNESEQESFTTTANPTGTITNQTSSNNLSKNKTHNFNIGLQSNDDPVNFLAVGLQGSVGGGDNNSLTASTLSSQNTKQDLLTKSNSHQRSPSLNGNIDYSRRLDKKGRNISATVSANTNLSNNENNLYNQIGNYDTSTGLPEKPSILNQLVDTRNRALNLTANFTYTEPLGHGKDSASNRYLDFSYNFSLAHTRNGLESDALDTAGQLHRVDSLSNQYTSSFIRNKVGATYRYKAKKISYNIGLTAEPSQLTGVYEGRTDRVSRTGFNIAPVAHFSYMPSMGNTYMFFYNGNNIIPDFTQLQPVRDTRNLQNIIVGNPMLKAAFTHSANFSYRHVNMHTGSNLQVLIRGSFIQNQVVSNTILLRDTANILKQETHYENANGNYNLGANYYWSMPFSKKKYTVDLRGTMGYSHQVSFSDNVKTFGKGINLMQTAGVRMNEKWIRMSTEASYSYRGNTNSIPGSFETKIQTWMFNMDSKTFITKSFAAGLNASKTINQGFNLPANNPLIISGYLEKTFFASKAGLLRLEGNDLLKQGTLLNQSSSGSSVTESRSNQITRYFLISFSWRLQNFNLKG